MIISYHIISKNDCLLVENGDLLLWIYSLDYIILLRLLDRIGIIEFMIFACRPIFVFCSAI